MELEHVENPPEDDVFKTPRLRLWQSMACLPITNFCCLTRVHPYLVSSGADIPNLIAFCRSAKPTEIETTQIRLHGGKACTIQADEAAMERSRKPHIAIDMSIHIQHTSSSELP